MTDTAAVSVPSAAVAVRPVSAVPPMPGASSSYDELMNSLLARFRTDLMKIGIKPFRVPRELMEQGPSVRWPLKPVRRKAK